ncbi:4'-phosphopantetheinyl transferase superfamily protein [Bacillus carboniphilus]|uniref:4'-phosphopantetheinyl transferase superfamily protein n=1 Tax=Bacillus carboniphilus TaxID=86663 RepID=A0ABY9JWN9_9BACI|nr:4'-phosphopantetheinyl transferase superfamily protein [Bacillus carboniphilus]WLR43795.1 4'-phosphopantetheinyl transferase superfamily protein [Bacillus carboniphilus]
MNRLIIQAVHIHDDIRWDEYKSWVSMVSVERQIEISRLRLDKDRMSKMISEIMARKFISEECNVSYKSIRFHQGLYGKPYVNLETILHFNWSHAGNWVVFILDSHPIGIDVEAVRSIDEMELARQFFDQKEVFQLEEMDQKNRKNHFLKLWSLKESYMKWKGTGINTPLNSCCFIKDNQEEIQFSNENGDCCNFQTVQLDSIHHVAVCTSENYKTPPVVKIFQLNEFLNALKSFKTCNELV